MNASTRLLFCLIIALCALHCASTGDSTSPDFNISPTFNEAIPLDLITLNQIETESDFDNLSRCQVQIPIEIFDGTLDGASITITKNSLSPFTISDPSIYLVEEEQIVKFYMYNVHDGDGVSFTITLATGGIVLYKGTFSESKSTQAIIQSQDTGDDSGEENTTVGKINLNSKTLTDDAEEDFWIEPVE